MSELEQRIYDDAAKAAAEIIASDVPPLRLDRRDERSPHRYGPARRQRTRRAGAAPGRAGRRILAPLASAACVVVVIGVIVAVGHRPSTGSQNLSPAAANSASANAAHSKASRKLAAEALDWYFPASGTTYTAGLAFGWTEDKITAHDIDPCLATAGFPQPPFHGSVELYQLSFPSDQFPDLRQLSAHPGQHVFTGQYPVVKHPTTARMNAFDRAQARCTARYAQSVTRVDKAALALQDAWAKIIAKIDASPRVSGTQPAFASCLEAHGVPAQYASQTTHGSDPLFYGYGAWADAQIQSGVSQTQLAAESRHDTRVFVTCARPVVALLDQLQVERRAQFFHQNAAGIARISQLAGRLAA
jgi:hypothetical protein